MALPSPPLRRRGAARWLGGLCLVAACGGAGRDVEPIPTVVLISIDTLRADHLGCYGNTIVKTPRLDALASEGVRFAQAIATAPTTLNSHTSLMTGTYGHTHGAARNGFVVAERNEMLAEVLRGAGYRTAGFIGAFPLQSRFGFAQGFDHYDEPELLRSGEEVNASALAWLDEREEGPLFLFLHYWDSHRPFDPPPPFDRMYRTDDLDVGASMEELDALRLDMKAGVPVGERNRITRELYAGAVSHVDQVVGELLDGLKERGLYDDALILVTSDHGEAIDEHWEYWDHGESTYETTIHVPLIVRLPGGERGGTTEDRLVSLVDVMPTVLDLVDARVPPAVSGVGFGTLLRGGSLPPRAPVFAEATKPHDPKYEKAGAWVNARKFQTARGPRWKLIRRAADGVSELYDLERDPGETANVFADPGEGGLRRRAELAQSLDDWRSSAGAVRTEQDDSTEVLDGLKSLGYADDG